MKKRVLPIILSVMMVIGLIPMLGLSEVRAEGSAEIALWEGWHKAAATFTFDDGAPSHINVVAPLFDSYGYKATFYLVTNWNPDWSGFQQLADNGHEIGSHSDSHQGTMHDEEIASSKQTIESRIKSSYGCITLAFPNLNAVSRDKVLSNYIAGRIGNGSWQGLDDINSKNGPKDWWKVSALMTGHEGINTENGLISKMQEAKNINGWVVFLTHGIAGKQNGNATYSPTNLSDIDSALKWAKGNDIWVSSLCNVAMYIKERNYSKFELKASDASSRTYTLTHSIADSVCRYDYPLSVRVSDPLGRTPVSVSQGGEEIAWEIENGWIYFSAVPNSGDIVIKMPAHEHVWDGGEITRKPTTSVEGIKTYTCISCGEKRTETIPKLKAPAEKITIPKKPTNKKPSVTKNKITVNWKHFKHTSKKTRSIWKKIKKVQVQCATDKAFKNIVKTTTAKKSKTSAKIKGLKKKTTYYVRVRYYDGTGYSAWSKVKKVKTK